MCLHALARVFLPAFWFHHRRLYRTMRLTYMCLYKLAQVFFPAFWFHHTESLDLSFSVGFRYFSVA